MGALVADTHAAIWYLYRSGDLSRRALGVLREAVQQDDPIFVASISLVEAIYLAEKGRVPRVALDRLDAALSQEDSGLVPVALDMKVARAVERIPREIVPDLPDRISAATALSLNLPLVTRDRQLRAANIQTIW